MIPITFYNLTGIHAGPNAFFFTTPPATAAQAKLFALKIQMFIV
jgi:hypothetical protein